MDSAITETVHPSAQVVLEGEGRSWSAYAPGLPCVATGHSQDDVRRNIEQAFTYYLEELREIALEREAGVGAAPNSASANAAPDAQRYPYRLSLTPARRGVLS
jgi:predicted RNase H-like HicB family nuclease